MGGGKQLNVELYSLLHTTAGHGGQIWLPKKPAPETERRFSLFLHFLSICEFIYLQLYLKTAPGSCFTSRACFIPKAVLYYQSSGGGLNNSQRSAPGKHRETQTRVLCWCVTAGLLTGDSFQSKSRGPCGVLWPHPQ